LHSKSRWAAVFPTSDVIGLFGVLRMYEGWTVQSFACEWVNG
jgi:hypothetical protein